MWPSLSVISQRIPKSRRRGNASPPSTISPWVVKKFIKEYGFSLELLNKYPLYPDQLVYLNNCLVNSPELITVEDGLICYHTDIKQATVLEETLSAYAFVVKSVKDNGLSLSLMSEKEVSFINNWEAEKYRRSVK